LREEGGFNVDVLLEEMSVKRKFRYVTGLGAKVTVVVGSEEEDSNVLAVQYVVGLEAGGSGGDGGTGGIGGVGGSVVKTKVPYASLCSVIRGLIR
ncbi:MAG: His/Gly/Thr/Pro-type tRNA ligase C-terminal domain-containing protein, partial [Oscillospiraceae bacterium]|nr:His/Gly/Thr/Pro-type tRNA ligase C-terminal domain-containing protein [Oscillospiraceae bacterium]